MELRQCTAHIPALTEAHHVVRQRLEELHFYWSGCLVVEMMVVDVCSSVSLSSGRSLLHICESLVM